MSITKDDTLPSFSEGAYAGVAMNDLVTYGVYILSQTGREIIEADIVAVCFLMFPRRFELRGYPEWPDSSVILRRWLDCRGKGLIEGSTKDGFTLTPKGLKLAEKVHQLLGNKGPQKLRLRAETRTRAGRFVREIENSIAYKTYKLYGANAEIAEYDFRGMLLCTMESSAATLKNNLRQFREYAAVYQRNDLIDFLEEMRKLFAELLEEKKESGDFKEGMVRRRVRR